MKQITEFPCTGCGACYAICPVKSIKMHPDRLNQIKPDIDQTKCVDCGLCQKICPQNQVLDFQRPFSCYAACSKNPDDIYFSASGGVAAVFSRFVYDNKGFVFGCDYNDNGELLFYRACSMEQLNGFRSSKYTRASLYRCYGEIKTLLNDSARTVLIIGLPCQVAGLRCYLNKDYNNLITVDLVCHGTPPNEYLMQHLKEKKICCPYDKIRFRGEYDQKLSVWNGDGICYQQDKDSDLFFSAFYLNMISYESCFSCKYAQDKRISDITIGDFWGLGESKIKSYTNRPSLVLINTKKGEEFFDSCSFLMYYENRCTSEGIKGNGRLNNPPGKNEYAKAFRLLYSINPKNFNRTVVLSKFIGEIIQLPSKGKIILLKYLYLLKRGILKIKNIIIH